MAKLTAARYGKDNVRLYKVHRNEQTGVQSVTETTVCVLLEGDIETSYTKADNSVIVATDTCKNTVYLLAKQNPVTPPELFASILASHFPATYSHIHAAHIKIITHRWARMTIDNSPHPHSFYRDGSDVRTTEVTFRRNEGLSIRSGLKGLAVLKSTGSQFHGFIHDEYATLKDTYDRILSTDVDATWAWRKFADVAEVKKNAAVFDRAFDSARAITMDKFAKDNSASVQATMYKMCEQIIADNAGVEDVTYELPNKHYFEIDLSWHKGLKNTGKDAEVYAPQSSPNGLIKCTVSRSDPKSKL